IAVTAPPSKPEQVKVKQEPVAVLEEKILVEEAPLKKAEIKFEALHIDNPLSGDALREDIYAELEKLQKLKHDFEISFDEFQSAHPNGSGTYYSPDGKAEKEPAAEPLIEE